MPSSLSGVPLLSSAHTYSSGGSRRAALWVPSVGEAVVPLVLSPMKGRVRACLPASRLGVSAPTGLWRLDGKWSSSHLSAGWRSSLAGLGRVGSEV